MNECVRVAEVHMCRLWLSGLSASTRASARTTKSRVSSHLGRASGLAWRGTDH